MNIGKVFALAEQRNRAPAEPLKRLISGCTGVPTLEFILLVAEYDGTDCQNLRLNLSWNALSHTLMSLLMGFDTHATPDRGTVVETLVAQYAMIWWFGGGTICQTPGQEYFDWSFTPYGANILDYILWRANNQWAPHANVPTRWEHKCASINYIIVTSTSSYTYVTTTFCFKPRQIQAIVAGDIHYVMLTFLDRKTLRARCLVVEGARFAACCVGGKPKCGSNCQIVILATQLVDTPLRVSTTGQVMPGAYPRDVAPPLADEASNVPVLPIDFDRLVDRCLGRGRSVYAGPFAVAELGEIRGRTLQRCPLIYVTRLLMWSRRARRSLAVAAAQGQLPPPPPPPF